MTKFRVLSGGLPYRNQVGVSQRYGNPDARYSKGYNQGEDYPFAEGTPIPFEYSGRVIDVGNHPQWGTYVTVRDDNGYSQQYSHLSEVNVSVGDRVEEGQTGIKSGSTGWVTGPHLDYTVRDPDGNDIDPQSYEGEDDDDMQQIIPGDTGDADRGYSGLPDEEPEVIPGSGGIVGIPVTAPDGTILGWNVVETEAVPEAGLPAKYKFIPAPKATAGSQPRSASALAKLDDSHTREVDAHEYEYRQGRDAINDERYKEERDYNRAIDEGRYADAQAIKERITALQEKQQQLDEDFRRFKTTLDEQYRRDTLKLQAELGYAYSRRQDVSLGLQRQNQAFNQEQTQIENARATASRPSSYLEYAFTTAGVKPPPGTRLADVMARIKPTPGVEDYLNQQFGQPAPGATTGPPANVVGGNGPSLGPSAGPSLGPSLGPSAGPSLGPPAQYDEASIIQELEQIRRGGV